MLLPVALVAAALVQTAAPAAADLTLPPETAQLVTILEGRGVQIYTCSTVPGGYGWTLTAPDAQLYNLATGKQVGHHDAGPTWTLEDGSAIHGTLLHKKVADTAADVPWLLLQAQPANETRGTLSNITYVRRYNTHGGNAPATGCNAAQAGQALRVPYSATYAFYTTPGAPALTQTAPQSTPPPPQ